MRSTTSKDHIHNIDKKNTGSVIKQIVKGKTSGCTDKFSLAGLKEWYGGFVFQNLRLVGGCLKVNFEVL